MSVAAAPAPQLTSPEACWTCEDVARCLRIGRTTVLLWIEQGRLPRPNKIGRRWLWELEKIRALLADEEV
jgi:excisionase family DNA binding protein